MDPVQVRTEGGVMTATLVDVENRNALGAALVQGLRDALAAANRDPAIRELVVTNAGSTFCAGANLKEQRSRGPAPRSGSGGFVELLQEIQASPTPVVGRIAGHVVGGGNGLAAAFDIAIAADHVKFGFTEVRLGVAPAIIAVVCLPKMRRAEAMEAFLRGHRFTASRAAELGLVSRAVPAAELDAALGEALGDRRLGAPRALAAAKRLVQEVPALEQKEAFEWAAALSGQLFASDGGPGGMTAFSAKRAPAWASPTRADVPQVGDFLDECGAPSRSSRSPTGTSRPGRSSRATIHDGGAPAALERRGGALAADGAAFQAFWKQVREGIVAVGRRGAGERGDWRPSQPRALEAWRRCYRELGHASAPPTPRRACRGRARP
jgi:methylglutaconyl-CoA hydratase